MPTSRTRGLLLATLTSVLWGTVPIAGKVALGGITSPALSSLRLLLAAAFVAVLLARRSGNPFRRPPGLVYLAGLMLGANYALYMWGLERAGAATAQVLIQTAPLFLIVLSLFLLRERLSARQMTGGAAAVAGVFLVSWNEAAGSPRSAFGVTLILAAALTWAVYAVAHKRLGRDHPSGPTIMWIFLIAGLSVVPAAAVEPLRRPDGVQMAAIAYLCVNSIVAYWAFAEALRHIEASVAGVICTLGPVVTFTLLALTNRMDQQRIPLEPLTAVKFAGAALVIGGVGAAVSARR